MDEHLIIRAFAVTPNCKRPQIMEATTCWQRLKESRILERKAYFTDSVSLLTGDDEA